jgi:diadenosine tetraphosphate (Ap4A) HIT family hydrolase
MELIQAVDSLFESQLKNWELARVNIGGLQNVKVKPIAFEGFEILLQYNPKRILSSSAKVDPPSISARPCFLCIKNRPPEQQGIRYMDNFILLVNPYPVFPGHLTIPTLQHEPQRILSKFTRMLEIARDLPQYTIIYNGPQCGASAPDHFHFQAVRKGHMPVEADFLKNIKCVFNFEKHGIGIYTWDNYLRRMITLRGHSISKLESLFNTIYDLLPHVVPSDDEPMVNILTGYNLDHFVIHLIPRKLHRPDRYFAQGERQLLLSPASIDLGGVLIIPREEDFLKITKADISDIFQQVGVDNELIQYLVHKLT